jgi:hypothetical protein
MVSAIAGHRKLLFVLLSSHPCLTPKKLTVGRFFRGKRLSFPPTVGKEDWVRLNQKLWC